MAIAQHIIQNSAREKRGRLVPVTLYDEELSVSHHKKLTIKISISSVRDGISHVQQKFSFIQ